MWKESATKAMELVIYPTIISTKKKEAVRVSIEITLPVLPKSLFFNCFLVAILKRWNKSKN